jgi:hypothetical protein
MQNGNAAFGPGYLNCGRGETETGAAVTENQQTRERPFRIGGASGVYEDDEYLGPGADCRTAGAHHPQWKASMFSAGEPYCSPLIEFFGDDAVGPKSVRQVVAQPRLFTLGPEVEPTV